MKVQGGRFPAFPLPDAAMARGLALARWRGAMLVLLAAAQPCVAIDPVHSMMEPPPPKLQRPRVSRPVVGGLQRAGILASLSSPSLLLLPAALMGLAVAFPEPMARLALHVLQPAQNADSNSGRQGLGLASARPAQWRVGGPPHLRLSHSCSACSQRLDRSRKAGPKPAASPLCLPVPRSASTAGALLPGLAPRALRHGATCEAPAALLGRPGAAREARLRGEARPRGAAHPHELLRRG